jgi:hypothetical protein
MSPMNVEMVDKTTATPRHAEHLMIPTILPQVEVIESRKDLYQACVSGRTAYGSSRSGASSSDFVYQLMVMIGPEVRRPPAHNLPLIFFLPRIMHDAH